jgi:hypothetical protein
MRVETFHALTQFLDDLHEEARLAVARDEFQEQYRREFDKEVLAAAKSLLASCAYPSEVALAIGREHTKAVARRSA